MVLHVHYSQEVKGLLILIHQVVEVLLGPGQHAIGALNPQPLCPLVVLAKPSLLPLLELMYVLALCERVARQGHLFMAALQR